MDLSPRAGSLGLSSRDSPFIDPRVAGNAFATPAIPGAPPDILHRGISGVVKPEKNGDFIPEASKQA